MKRAVLSCLCAAAFAVQAAANTYSFAPTPGNLGDLDHNLFFTWGLSWAVPTGEKITSASLTFTRIWDWRVEPDALFIHLLDTAPMGVNSWTDNEGGGDFFASSTFASLGIGHVKLGEISDPFGGDPTKAQTITLTFNAAQLVALQGYITNATPSGWAQFAFGLDPDCHYYNDGISFRITTAPAAVPDVGSSILLLGMASGGIVFLRRKLRG